jgi:hypothetical protein
MTLYERKIVNNIRKALMAGKHFYEWAEEYEKPEIRAYLLNLWIREVKNNEEYLKECKFERCLRIKSMANRFVHEVAHLIEDLGYGMDEIEELTNGTILFNSGSITIKLNSSDGFKSMDKAKAKKEQLWYEECQRLNPYLPDQLEAHKKRDEE